MKKLIYILIGVLAAGMLAGCASKKKVVKEQPKTTVVKKKTIEERAIEAQPDFTSVVAQKAKFNINYQQRQYNANGTITLVKDSILIISVQPLLGIELLRLEATKEDVRLIDKMNRRYDSMTYEQISKQVGVTLTYDDLQAIAMNRVVRLDKQRFLYNIDEKTLAVLKTTVQIRPEKEALHIEYSGHTLHDASQNGTTQAVLFPSKITVRYVGTMEAAGDITLPNLTFNKSVNATRLNVAKYKKVDFMSIISGK